MEQAVAVEFAFRGGFKRFDGRGSFVTEQRAQAERWCCFGFAVVSKWWASQWSLSGMRGGDCGWGWGAPALKGSLSWLDVLRAGLLPPAAFPAAGSTSRSYSRSQRPKAERAAESQSFL